MAVNAILPAQVLADGASDGDLLTVQADGSVAFETPAGGGGGISSLNGLTDSTQTFATGTSGTDVAFVSATGVHTLDVPDASATARGVVTTGTQRFAGLKYFEAGLRLGTGSNDQSISAFASTFYIDNNAGSATQFRQGAAGTQCSMNRFSPTFRTVSLSIGHGTSSQTVLESRAAHVLEQRNGTNAQRVEIYNTFTTATSLERLSIAWSGNVCTIETEAGSAGGTLRGLKIGGASTSLLGFYGSTPVDQPATVADPSGGSTVDTEARAAVSAVIDRLQELGLIA